SKAIQHIDLISLMKEREKSSKIIDFCLEGGDIMNDRIWRPRLVQVIGKQALLHGERLTYYFREEWKCLIRNLQQGGLLLDPDRLCHHLKDYSKNQRTGMRNATVMS
ncbi:hypothetical protein PFISCL1PPCAC_18204, partial [Pristionchus fissidentatus]